jgi:hypothetical protein
MCLWLGAGMPKHDIQMYCTITVYSYIRCRPQYIGMHISNKAVTCPANSNALQHCTSIRKGKQSCIQSMMLKDVIVCNNCDKVWLAAQSQGLGTGSCPAIVLEDSAAPQTNKQLPAVNVERVLRGVHRGANDNRTAAGEESGVKTIQGLLGSSASGKGHGGWPCREHWHLCWYVPCGSKKWSAQHEFSEAVCRTMRLKSDAVPFCL